MTSDTALQVLLLHAAAFLHFSPDPGRPRLLQPFGVSLRAHVPRCSPRHRAAFSSATSRLLSEAGCAQTACCSCLSCFSSRLSSFSFNSEARRGGLCKHHAKCAWIYFCDSSGDTCLTHTLFPNKSTNELGNMHTLLYALKNNTVEHSVYRSFFWAILALPEVRTSRVKLGNRFNLVALFCLWVLLKCQHWDTANLLQLILNSLVLLSFKTSLSVHLQNMYFFLTDG